MLDSSLSYQKEAKAEEEEELKSRSNCLCKCVGAWVCVEGKYA